MALGAEGVPVFGVEIDRPGLLAIPTRGPSRYFGGDTALIEVVREAVLATGVPEVRLGIVPAVISPYALAKIGRSAARELFLTGHAVDAERARQMGMVNRVVDRLELEDIAFADALEIGKNGPIAVAGMRAVIKAIEDDAPPSEAAEIAERWRQRAFASSDIDEGLAAFRAKREPEFTGE